MPAGLWSAVEAASVPAGDPELAVPVMVRGWTIRAFGFEAID